MIRHCRLKIMVLSLTLALAAVCWPAEVTQAARLAQAVLGVDDQELAETYASVLYFHPDELFRPQSVDVLLGTARLQQARSLWPDVRLLNQVTPADLPRYTDGSYYLNAWFGDEMSSDYKNYSAHRAYYRSHLSPDVGGPPVVAYAHVVRDAEAQRIAIQYWLFYWYNDAFNKHEGDWEMVQVLLTAAGEPEEIVLSQHHGGTRRPWSAARIEDDTHPAVYVALGSHANYFWGDEIYLAVQPIGNARVIVADRTGTAGRIAPDVVLIPDREEIQHDPARWVGCEWLLFRGGWGERAPQADFGGPLGPADKGEQWERPLAWGTAQPLDTDAWYTNRLRVEVSGSAGGAAQVRLRGSGVDGLAVDQAPDGIALLHTDPITDTAIVADIEAMPGQRYDILVTWPDVDASRVVRYQFQDVLLGALGRATLALSADEPPILRIAGNIWRDRPMQISRAALTRRPTVQTTAQAFWDAPDVIWVLGFLPAADVFWGVALSLLAALLPPLVYVAVLYWADQYEKEPVRLLAATFLWASLPALLVSVAVRLFFRLPPSLLGPGAVQLVSNTLVAALVEEALVGSAVLFVAWRHRREFDGVLDGIIYGAVAGLGFAMTANLISYLGAFFQYGFAGLGHTVLVDGFLYGMNQALYAAILGAGLGYARVAPRRWQRWAVPLVAFVLAVATRAFHNLAIDQVTGWNLWTLAVIWAGWLVLLAVMLWSMREERRCLADELVGEVPEPLYTWLARPGGCWLAEWRALWRGGPRAVRRVRRATQCCTRLAFKKAQCRRPGATADAAEIPPLRRQVAQAVDPAMSRLFS